MLGEDKKSISFIEEELKCNMPTPHVLQVMSQDGRVQPLSPALRAKATQTINHMAEKALRCLAFAQKTDLGTLLHRRCSV